ncbi:AbiH family protein [Latilactobacillus sp. 5-91]|uniref:AbiH family protein n=1 Tax=Latilactobacillus sp. 5-91 TaxID=3410924 RepID=UPI003C76BE7F
MIEKLIIVGNGYDLARQYKTSYSDFFDWLIIKFNIDSSQIKNIVELDDIDKLVQNLSEHECILKSNFWFAYMTLLKPNNSDWNNVEKIIETTLELIPNEINKLYDEDKNVIKAVADMGSNFEKKVLFTTLLLFIVLIHLKTQLTFSFNH